MNIFCPFPRWLINLVEGKYFAHLTTSQIFPLCLYIASCKEKRLGMNWGMSQSRPEGATDNNTMHHFQSRYQSGRLTWVTNYKALKRLACVQRLRLLRPIYFWLLLSPAWISMFTLFCACEFVIRDTLLPKISWKVMPYLTHG